MISLLIALHVLAAILLIGPVTVATSAFPAQMMKAANGDAAAFGATKTLHRISNTYGYLSAIVPVIGVAIFLVGISNFGTQGQYHASILLAIIAWIILLFVIVPRQKSVLAALEKKAGAGADTDAADAAKASTDLAKDKKQLSMFSGIFALLWIVTAILMFI